jgi:hypothetical protein
MSKHAVFTIKPKKKTNYIKIKYVGTIENEKIADDLVKCMFDNKDNEFIFPIMDNIVAQFYHCNISDIFLLQTKTLPVMYASVLYQNKFLTSLLFNIFISFTIKTNVKSDKELINSTLEGEYEFSIKLDDDDKDISVNIDLPQIPRYPGTYEMIELFKKILLEEKTKNLINIINEKRRQKRIEKFGSFTNFEKPVPKYNFTKLVEEYRKTGKIIKNNCV